MGNEQSTPIKHQKANAAENGVLNGELNGHAVPPSDTTEPAASKEAQQQKSKIPPAANTNKPKTSPGKEEVDKAKEHVETSPDKDAADAEPPKPSEEEATNVFSKLFKKKAEPLKLASEGINLVDGLLTTANEKSESVAIKASTETETVPEVNGLLEDLVEAAQELHQSEETKPAEKTVMNFFKTFASSSKTSKDAKATPDASKDQSQKETLAASSANVQEAPKAPPPPPPAPPKMEVKAEPAVKKEETSATAANKEADASAKTKTKDSAFSKFFRPKPVLVEEKKPVEVQVDASKTSTLEAAAKPEEPKPKPEEKKQEKKSAFGSMFKPKATEPKKETPAAPAAAESAPIAKAKEEPKPAGPAAPAAPDNKSVGSTDNPSPSNSRKLEKRNSVQLFFKNLGQKRHSDAGVQTDPVAPEKAK